LELLGIFGAKSTEANFFAAAGTQALKELFSHLSHFLLFFSSFLRLPLLHLILGLLFLRWFLL
jgi:hypothetical protein